MSRKIILDTLRQLNLDYPLCETPSHTLGQMKSFNEGEQQEFKLCGRVSFLRSFGKGMFLKIHDSSGSFQLFLSKQEVGEDNFKVASLVQAGDIVFGRGQLFKTQRGEVTLNLKEIKILTKCLHSLPEKFHGLQDQEMRFRQRYLDLFSNEEVQQVFINRSKIVQSLRNYLLQDNFLEVETPILQSLATGANAKPFTTHHNSLDMELFLRIAPELYLKRLVVGGFNKVFELNRNFRNEGLSTKHNPEFTMLEFYEAYGSYQSLMTKLTEMIQSSSKSITGNLVIQFNNQSIDLNQFHTLTMEESIVKYSKYQGSLSDEKSLKEYASNFGEVTDLTLGEVINFIFGHEVEPLLIQPHFITEYPLEVSPLARRSASTSQSGMICTERFELFIGGMEIANGFNELNDPEDQLSRFENQVKSKAHGADESHPVDLDYITALEYGLPPTAGAGLGVDRLVMLLLNQSSIKDVILFPHMRPQK